MKRVLKIVRVFVLLVSLCVSSIFITYANEDEQEIPIIIILKPSADKPRPCSISSDSAIRAVYNDVSKSLFIECLQNVGDIYVNVFNRSGDIVATTIIDTDRESSTCMFLSSDSLYRIQVNGDHIFAEGYF